MAEYKFQMEKDKAGEWRWRFVAPNNKLMADSGEGYVNYDDCLSEVRTIKKEAAKAKVYKITT